MTFEELPIELDLKAEPSEGNPALLVTSAERNVHLSRGKQASCDSQDTERTQGP